jgi:DNA-binding SARP family transcriptional activator
MHSTAQDRQKRQAAGAAAPVAASRPQPELRISVLGPLEVAWRGIQIRLASASARALLVLLALSRQPLARDTVAADLWPEFGARSSAALRQALWLLRAGLAEAGAEPRAVIYADDTVVGFVPGLTVDVDARRFEALMREVPPRCEPALRLYRGDLVVAHFQESFARERERLADAYDDSLALASQRRLASGDLDGARDAALRLLSRDPLREEGHATLIEIYGRAGSRSQVTRQYRRLQALLEAELDISPLAETEATYRAALRFASTRSRNAMTARGDREVEAPWQAT